MQRPRQRPRWEPAFEPLEGRAFQSAAPTRPAFAAAAFGVPSGIKVDPAAAAAILKALRGGPGNEFVTLIRRQVNPGAVIRGFVSGQRTEFNAAGAAFKVPKFQAAFNAGPKYDHLSILGAGALLQQRGTVFQLGAILLGPYDENATSQIVFGLDRGSGASRGARFAERPGITPDALVTLTIGPNGSTREGKIEDLNTGSVTAIDASKIQINGSTIRVFVQASDLPSAGLPITKYRFAAWTHAGNGGGIETVGSFAPETKMIPIGVLSPPPRTRR